MKAIWNEKVIAESDDIVNVEGNSYFPVESVKNEYLKESDTHTVCHWKGTASYYNLDVEGKTNRDAAWYYSDPRPLAEGIKGRIAFWKGVQIVKN
jgi:uncharacterized protein (DUF427 family)